MGTSRIGRTIALFGAAVSLTFAATAGVAVAAGSGEPVATDGGSVVVTQRGTTTISDVTKPGVVTPLATTEKVGGGTWTYGRTAAAWPKDKCFSNYVHNSVYHSATVIFNDGTSKRFADPSLYAKASVTKHFTTSGCKAYWGKY